jgi:hypothetical protein
MNNENGRTRSVSWLCVLLPSPCGEGQEGEVEMSIERIIDSSKNNCISEGCALLPSTASLERELEGEVLNHLL